jgi:hypothetical protein
MSERTFDLAEVVAGTRALSARTREALESSTRADVRALAAAITEHGDATVFSLALVGAYDAGKSTLVSALTGRDDILIGSDVSTSTVTPYRWSGVELYDTPGIHAGRPDHDALTYGAIDRADLLLFVVTNELFDHRLASHFRELAFARGRAPQTMLVVNKMTQDPGTPADKLPDVARVTEPLTPADLRTVFIDARCALDARTADEPDRSELVELSGWPQFVGALNRFIRDHGHLGRQAHPLHALSGVLAAAEGRVASDDDSADRMRLELLHRKRLILVAAERRLRVEVSALVDKGCGDVVTMGDSLAESLEPAADAKSLDQIAKDTSARASRRTDTLVRDADALYQRILNDVDREIAALEESPLARDLDARAKLDAKLADTPGLTAPTDGWKAAQRHAKTTEAWAGQLTKLARGPGAASSEMGAAAASGSRLHQAVYAVGKSFGHQFRPWQAVNIAKNIGNVARVVGVVAGVLGPLLQYVDERHSEKVERDLRDARRAIRAAYRDAASDVAVQFRAQVEGEIATVIGREIGAVDEEHNQLVQARQDRSAEAHLLAKLRGECRELLGRFGSQDD